MTVTPLTDQQLADCAVVAASRVLLDSAGRLVPKHIAETATAVRATVDAVLAVVQPELDRLRTRLATEQKVNTHLVEKHTATLAAADKWLEERAQLLAGSQKLAAELGRVCAELAREVRQHGQTIDDRDRATDMADKLAAAIAPETVIGEHSGMNDPWQNALDCAAEKTYTVPGCGCQTAVHPGHYPSCPDRALPGVAASSA